MVPEEYQKCMVGMKRNLKQTLEIRDRDTASDPKVKIQAAAIANDCYHSIMDQCWYCIRCHKVNGNKEEPTKYDAKSEGLRETTINDIF